MSSLNRVFKVLKTGKRCFSGKKRKYPVNPEDINKLPVFQYNISKESYNRLYVCGNTTTGALGVPYLRSDEDINKVSSFRSPKRLGFAEKYEVSTAACGFGFTLFAVNSNTDVKIYGTGLNADSQIGYHAVREGHPLDVIYQPQPISLRFASPEETKIKKISAGRAHSIVLSDEGIHLFGNNSYGQCGRVVIEDEDYSHSNFVNHIPNIEGKQIIDVECGQDHSVVLTNDGAVYSCGWGADGQTGLGHYNNCSIFTRVLDDIGSENIVKVACRSDFVMALNDKGEVFGWGNTEYEQMTLPDMKQQICVPTLIEMVKPLGKIKDVATGGSFCMVLNEEGDVFVWGYGLLGTGPNTQQSSKPIKIPHTLFGRNDFQPTNVVTKIVSGISHMAAVTSLGDMYTWGRNRNCCLGLGFDKDQYFPLKVSLAGHVKDAFCGIDHTIALCKPFI